MIKQILNLLAQTSFIKWNQEFLKCILKRFFSGVQARSLDLIFMQPLNPGIHKVFYTFYIIYIVYIKQIANLFLHTIFFLFRFSLSLFFEVKRHFILLLWLY